MGLCLWQEGLYREENTSPSFKSLSAVALRLGLMYLRVGLCHPEYSIISASVLKVPSVVYGYDNGVVMGPGELEFIKAQVPL